MISVIEKRPGAKDDSVASELLISADSHVIEDSDLWVNRVAPAFKDRAPRFPPRKVGNAATFTVQEGGWDPNKRLTEMAVDGVRAEVLYPSLALTLFGQEDARLQEECFRVYNDWLMEYCQVSPGRLVGVACLSAYDIDQAVRELERCRKGGLRGALVWQVPHPDLPFTSKHYDKLWAAAEGLQMPISLHILSGFGYAQNLLTLPNLELLRTSVITKLNEAANTIFDLIYTGVLNRFPKLKFVIVENEVGWMPFMVEQWDRYYVRFKTMGENRVPITRKPSEYIHDNFFASFFNDPAGGYLLGHWGQDNAMWSNDFPHGNSTWPNSRQVIARDLGHLSPEVRRKILNGNVAKLYGLDIAAITAAS